MNASLHLSVKGLDRVHRRLKKAEKGIEAAKVSATNRLAYIVRNSEKKEMRRVFDRPTPFTLRNVWVTRTDSAARPARVTLASTGKGAVQTPSYLWTQVHGGSRRMKAFERRLQQVGAMPTGWRAVPGEGAKLDRYGNMSRGQIVQILSWFRAFREAGYNANLTDEGRRRRWRGTKRRYGWAMFAVNPQRPDDRTRHLPPGIYIRHRSAFGNPIKPLLLFVPDARYRPRLDFYGVAERAYRKHAKRVLSEELRRRLR